ncbi:hypothetical protein LTAR_01393 [Leptolinea tardivitalis]|nr:hypothetical protein LTAR_01393 [Leptolinea tardivitalis]
MNSRGIYKRMSRFIRKKDRIIEVNKQLENNRTLPLIILIVTGLIIGFFLFDDYGASWDEPDLYTYADQSIRAYSIHDRISGQFSLDSLLGPDNLRLYGPAYLIFGRLVVNLFKFCLPGVLEIDLWHLVNFWVYWAGMIVFYLLLLRWFKPLVSLLTVLLFATQPVVFGISWIDPKDIPFMVLFIISLYFGLKLVDRLSDAFRDPVLVENRNDLLVFKKETLRKLNIVCLCLISLSIIIFLFSPTIENTIRSTIMGMQERSESDLIYTIFHNLARQSQTVPLKSYAGKAVSIFYTFRSGLTFLSIFLTTFSFSLKLFPLWINRLIFLIKSVNASYFKKGIRNKNIWTLSIACFFLGVTTSTRVLGPLMGILTVLELCRHFRWRSLPIIALYFMGTVVITYIFWPYLWQDTIQRFIDVFIHMSDNPVSVGVLFRGTVYDSKDLPADYLPWLLGVTLTIPSLFFIITGFLIYCFRLVSKKIDIGTWIFVAWLMIPLGYVLIFRPAMYDNYRHFLFILPALFFFSALSFDSLLNIKKSYLIQVLCFVAALSGCLGIVRDHPYEYSFYNSLVGGMEGAAGKYETDYWLTCYRELTEQVNRNESNANNIFVAFVPNLVRYYADKRFEIIKANDPSYPPDSLLFLPLRREALYQYQELPVAYRIQNGNVTLCLARRVE